MVRQPTADFVLEKNRETNAPIWLYRVNISDKPNDSGENDLFVTEWPKTLSYYREDAGVYTPQEFVPFPMSHGGLSENTQGQIQTLSISLANVSREMQYFVEHRNGLRGRKVTAWQVFQALLSDPLSHVEDIYYIDSVSCSPSTLEFRLTSSLDLMKVPIPSRVYMRDFCPWIYKGLGCWVSDGVGGYTQPTNFSGSTIKLIPVGDIVSAYGYGTSTATIAGGLTFDTNDFTNWLDHLHLQIDIKATNPGNLRTDSYLEVGFVRMTTTYGYRLTNLASMASHDIDGKSISAVWQRFIIPLSAFSPVAYDKEEWIGSSYSRLVYGMTEPGTAPTTSSVVLEYRGPRIYLTSQTPLPISGSVVRSGTASFTYVADANRTFPSREVLAFNRATDYLEITMKADDPARLSSNGRISLYNGVSELYLANLLNIAAADVYGQSITSGWLTYRLNLSVFSTGVGGFSTSYMDRVRWQNQITAGAAASFIYFINPGIITRQGHGWKVTDDLDYCLKTLNECRRHGNQLRYGGFPNVPRRKTFFL